MNIQLGALFFCMLCFAAWLTHIVISFEEGMWGFLIGGMMFFPLGIGHGFYLWFT